MSSLTGFPPSGEPAEEPMDEEEEEEEEKEEEEGEEVEPAVDQGLLQQLKDMGFAEGRAKKALLLTGMNSQAAMEWLLEHEGDPNIDEPLSQEQLRQLRRRATVVPDPQERMSTLCHQHLAGCAKVDGYGISRGSSQGGITDHTEQSRSSMCLSSG